MGTVFARPLLATEHSEHDRGAEAVAFELGRRCAQPLRAVLPLTSNPEFEAVAPALAARADADAARRREQLLAVAAALAVPLDVQVRHGAEPFEEIVGEARERAADLLVIRRRGRRGLLANLLLGEMVHKVVAHAPCDVLVCPRDASIWSGRVLAGLDPATRDAGVLALAGAVAAEFGLPLRIVGVAEGEAGRAGAEQALAAALQQLDLPGVAIDAQVRVGRPHDEIIAAARAGGADLIVIGRRGTGVLGRAWLGGTAQKVIGLARCPVLIHVGDGPPRSATP